MCNADTWGLYGKEENSCGVEAGFCQPKCSLLFMMLDSCFTFQWALLLILFFFVPNGNVIFRRFSSVKLFYSDTVLV